eukprot:SAG31_NODE_1445_length_8320_cov_3.454081_15_plen_293_part_00
MSLTETKQSSALLPLITWPFAGDGAALLCSLVCQRATTRIFQALEDKTQAGEIEASVQCSFLEIYCEEIRDLLNPSNRALKLHETPTKGVWVDGLTELFVSSAEEALNVIEIGDKCRSVAHTQMNEASSRSHSLFILNITQRRQDGSSTVSRLNLADLAGSEQVKKTGATGQTLEEAKKINQSLSALGNCINALTENRPYVPYRDSKLTHLLRESLGGNTKSNLIVCCSVRPLHPALNVGQAQAQCRLPPAHRPFDERTTSNHKNISHSPLCSVPLVSSLLRNPARVLSPRG